MIKYEDDIWDVEIDNITIGEYYKFNFSFIKSRTLKIQIKDYFFENLKKKNVRSGSLHRYSYSLKHFQKFLDETGQQINYFSELNALMVDQFIMYLKSTKLASKTSVVAYSALKAIVRYGQIISYPNYPSKDIFPNGVTRLFGIADTLYSKQLSDMEIIQIDHVIANESNMLLKSCILIAKETGLRLSEILLLEEGCVMEDFFGSPILFTTSIKGEKERAIPITDNLAMVISDLEKSTRDLRELMKTKLLFIKVDKRGKRIIKYSQSTARDQLRNFIRKNNIVNEEGKHAEIFYHRFRHNVGTDMINNGMSPFEVKLYLGHDSLHSTGIYAKVSDNTVEKEYERVGFLNITEKGITDALTNSGDIIEQQRVISGALPDGTCMKAFEGENHCKKYNICLFCDKYRTFVKDLPTHRDHLRRIREERENYMSEMSIGNAELVDRIELTLVTIIQRLEEIQNDIK